MKRYKKRWWKEIVERQKSICIVYSGYNDFNATIVRILNEKDELFPKSCMYNNYGISTYPSLIDLKTGKIFETHVDNLHFKKECIKMKKEYNKKYFDKLSNINTIREFYNTAIELYDWYDNLYDGKYGKE